MAKRKLLNLLRTDVRQWNEFRQKKPTLKIDFAQVNLQGANLAEANLNGVNFCSANLSQANLQKTKCNMASFIWANLSKSNFNNADLSEADFFNANLYGANLSRANCSNGRFTEANLSKANLSEAELSKSDLSGANLNKTNLNSANLCEGSLDYSDLNEAELCEADLNRASLFRANLRKSNLSKANLSKSILNQASLIETRLLSASLWRAVLTGAHIHNWIVNSETDFNEVICKYVYTKDDLKTRYPLNHDFTTNELMEFIHQSKNIVELVFENKIYWPFFLFSFQALQSKYSQDELFIEALERKDSNKLSIRLKIPLNSSGTVITREFTEQYNYALENLALPCVQNPNLEEIKDYKHSIDLLKLIELASYSFNT